MRKDSPKTPRPPAWLSAGAKAIWKQTVPLIPGFDPVLDRAILAAYCATLDHVNEARRNLQREDISPQERRAWLQILKDSEEVLFELAAGLGLTPGARLFITKGKRHAGH